MNKILIIPDVHGRTFWKTAVEKHFDDSNKIIFLGDYLDRYENEDITRKQEKENFLEIINFKKENKDKVVLLLGNHDLHYIEQSFTMSTRHSSNYAYSYKQIFLENKSLFKLAHEETINDKKILFTHAGLMNSWYQRNKNTIGELTVDNLNQLLNFPNGIQCLCDISKYRTCIGEESGSILWSDVREKINIDVMKDENDSITPNDDSWVDEYDYQIFGHTQLSIKPIITDKWACLDIRHAFIIKEDGKIYDA